MNSRVHNHIHSVAGRKQCNAFLLKWGGSSNDGGCIRNSFGLLTIHEIELQIFEIVSKIEGITHMYSTIKLSALTNSVPVLSELCQEFRMKAPNVGLYSCISHSPSWSRAFHAHSVTQSMSTHSMAIFPSLLTLSVTIPLKSDKWYCDIRMVTNCYHSYVTIPFVWF